MSTEIRKCDECGFPFEEEQTVFTVQYIDDLPSMHICEDCRDIRIFNMKE